jgi:hypothetical protein
MERKRERTSAQQAVDKAAMANVEAAIEVISSAAKVFADALSRGTGRSRKASGRKGSSKPKAAARPKRTNTKRSGARKSASAAGRQTTTRKAAAKKPARRSSQAQRKTPAKSGRRSSAKSRQGSRRNAR